jgi:phosphate-selective porin OprO/OprP
MQMPWTNCLLSCEPKEFSPRPNIKKFVVKFRTRRKPPSPLLHRPRRSELTGKFNDNFLFESADKQHAIGLTASLQADYRSFSPSDSNADTFSIRRALFGVKGKIYGDIGYEIVADFAPAASAVDSAYLNFGWFKNAQIRIGQFTMPFNLETIVSSSNIDYLERALNSNLAPNKELGAMVFGAPSGGFTYALAVSNGAGSNAADTVANRDGKDALGRVTFNVAEMMGRRNLVTHVGLAYSNGAQPAGALTGGVRTEGRGATIFTGSAPAGGAAFDRERNGVEFALATGPFKLQSEWIRSTFAGTAFSREVSSHYVSGQWALTGEEFAPTYSSGAFGSLKPRQVFSPAAGGGAWVVGLRYSQLGTRDFAPGTFTGTPGAIAYTLGLNWIPNGASRVMLNYVKTSYDNPITGLKDERALTLRTQANF